MENHRNTFRGRAVDMASPISITIALTAFFII
jgi:hypothetical protein